MCFQKGKIVGTTLYYFSGTGNSLMATKNLSEKFSECKIIPIAKIWKQEKIIADSEIVGFVFPMYFLGLPEIVAKVIEKINLEKVSYIFTVVTRGVSFTGGAIPQLSKILKAKGKKLNAGFHLTMTSNYIAWFDVPDKEELKKANETALSKIEKIANIVKNKQNKKEKALLSLIASFQYKPFIKSVHGEDKHFHTNENCNGCGTCTKVCPVDNIKLEENKPQWLHQCQQCFACINYCPQMAIQYDDVTVNRKRYQNPNITIKEILNQTHSD